MALTLNGTTGLSGIVGSAGTPALQGTDTNTGYFFGTDTLGLSTAGSERLRITAAGNLGLGNDGSFPIYTDTNDRNFILGTGSDDAAIQLHSGTDKYGGVYFGDATSGGDRYRGYVEFKHGTNDDYLRFAAGGNERLRITSVGKILIGTSTAQGNANADDLVVSTAGHSGITIRSGTSHNGNLFFADGTSGGDEYRGWIDYKHNDNVMSIGTNAAERFRIDSSGRLLIGHTASIDQNSKIQSFTTGTDTFAGFKYGDNAAPNIIRLGKSRNASIGGNTIVADDDEIGRIGFVGADGSDFQDCAAIQCFVDGAPSNGTDMPGRLVLSTTSDASGSLTERLRIKSDGETNIGTGSVNIAKFCQSGNKHQIVGQAADNVAALDVYSQHGNDGDRLSFAVSDNRTGSKSNAFAIRGDGNVLIDTTGNGYGGLKIYDDSGGDYNVRYVAGRNQSATSHVFMRSGRTQNQSPWADETPVEHARIARGGIAFGGDTADANTLDDYEEGTYTPVITCATSGGYNLSGSYYTMAYRKIGSFIHIQGYISVESESGTPNGTLRITLPKTAAALTQNADYTGIKILVRNHGSSNIYNQVAVTHGDGAYFNILFDDGNGGSTYMSHAHVDTNWQFFISGGYIGV